MTDTTSTTGCPYAAAVSGADKDYHGYKPFDLKDPFGAYAELREEAPVMFDDRVGLYVVTRYDDVKAVFDDWETFSSENAQAPVRRRGPQATKIMEEGGFTAYSGLSARIPPEHTRIRSIVQKAFRVKGQNVCLESVFSAVLARVSADIYGCWAYIGGVSVHSSVWCR